MQTKLEQPVPYEVGTAIKVILGGFLVIAGILLTLSNLDLVNAYPLLAYWPLVLVLIGLLKVLAPSGPLLGAALIVFGGWTTLLNLHIVHFTFFDIWPLLLVGVGGVMVARAFGWTPDPKKLAITIPDGGIVAVLASRNVAETTRDYRGSSMFSFLGGSQVDLSRAAMTQRPAIIDATAILGAIEILVPDDWEVSGEVVPVVGSFEMKCEQSTSPSAGELVIRGMAFMGGIEVKSVRRTS